MLPYPAWNSGKVCMRDGAQAVRYCFPGSRLVEILLGMCLEFLALCHTVRSLPGFSA